MRKQQQTWSVLVYTLILVAVSSVMALAILALASILSANAEIQEITRKLSNNVLSKGNLSIKYTNTVNSNGSGFLDVEGCPTSVTMSGTTNRSVTSSTLGYQSGSILCRGIHTSQEYLILVSSGGLSETLIEYRGDTISADDGNAQRAFNDADATLIDYTISFPLTADGYDDDFDSDDYKIGSTGSLLYPDGYQDDDADARKLLYWYATPLWGFTNMMWTNQKIRDYIAANPNNIDAINETLGAMTGSGHAYMDINQNHTLKLYQFDKTVFDATQELLPLSVYQSLDSFWDVWYLQEDAGVLSISTEKTGNEFEFDFATYDYGLFVRNNSTWALLYTLNIETDTGTGVYINAINDSDESFIKVLANDIIIDNQWRFLTEQFEVIGTKQE